MSVDLKELFRRWKEAETAMLACASRNTAGLSIDDQFEADLAYRRALEKAARLHRDYTAAIQADHA